LSRKISDSAIRRLSFYLRILEQSGDEGVRTVSSRDLAKRIGTTAAQVRKDLSLFGSFGKRGLGYSVTKLAESIRAILGLDRRWRVALVGAGRIGAALFDHEGLRIRGFDFVAVLDADPEKVGRRWRNLKVRDTSELPEVVREHAVDIVILAVPAYAAAGVMDLAEEAGIRAVLNFAPTTLRVSEDVTVRDVNMVMELEALSFALSHGEDRE
jgi:redox-sensing transcriptional repressor